MLCMDDTLHEENVLMILDELKYKTLIHKSRSRKDDTPVRSPHSAKHNISGCLARHLNNGLTTILPGGLLTISGNISPVQDLRRFKTADEGTCDWLQLRAVKLMQVGLKLPRGVKVLRINYVRRRQWGPDFFSFFSFLLGNCACCSYANSRRYRQLRGHFDNPVEIKHRISKLSLWECVSTALLMVVTISSQ